MYPLALIQQRRLWMVALLCFGGAFYSGYLLYLDLAEIGSSVGSGKVLAHVEQAIASVKRRSATSFLWSNVEHGTSLYRKDSIQVGPNSQAVIRLKDDSLLEIGERSLVVIEDVPPLEMKFLKGNFIVRGREQDHKITVEENQTVIESIPIRLMNPAPSEIFYLIGKRSQQVTFKWNPSEIQAKSQRNINPVLEISTSKRFARRLTRSIPIENNVSNTFTLGFPEGEYYWRVRADNLNVFETRTFSIEPPIIPELIYPTGGKQVYRWEKRAPLEFSWVAPPKSKAVPTWFELSQSKDFEKRSIVTRQEVAMSSGKVVVPNVGEGVYFWRLAHEYPGNIIHSAIENFSVERNANIPLTLAEPANNTRHPHQKPLTLAWNFAADGMDYRLQLQREERGVDVPLLDKITRERNFSWSPDKPGQHRWRVSASWKNEVVKSTEWQDFFVYDEYPVVILSPSAHHLYQYWKTPPEFALEWTPQDLVTKDKNRYRILVSTDADLVKNQRVFRTTDNKISRRTLKLPNGRYFWQVQVVDTEDRPLKLSSVQDFSLQHFPTLAAPQKASPSPSAVINVITSEKDAVATWEPIADAREYEFVLKQGTRTVASVRIDKPQYSFKDLKPGRYKWQTRAIDPLNRPGAWLPEREVTLSYGKRLQAPKILGSKVE